MDYTVSFGEWLRQRRRELDLTRAELACCAGCSVSAVRKIETDERRPSKQLAGSLADCLRIAPDERPSYLKVARGEWNVARLHSSASAQVRSRSGSTPHFNLPIPRSSLIGREAELAALGRLLRDPQCRMLTVVGPGGIGKTRLAIEAASLYREHFADGVCFVPLASLNAPEFVLPAVASALGFAFQGAGDPAVQLLNYLREKTLLLVLDSSEHLLNGLGTLTMLLQEAPCIKLLLTSRQRLESQHEWAFELQGLPVPPPHQREGLDDYSAVALFLEVARRVQGGKEHDNAEKREIARICRLLEGLPLGIELAAGWVRTLSCQEIAEEIEDGLDFLATTLRDVPERHRSMRAVFDHSWALLTEPERAVLRRLSVSQGGLRRQAAEEVTEGSLGLLTALVDKSLLRRNRAGCYDLHEVVRQYAWAKLEEAPEELEATCDRHSAYYTDFVAGLEADLKGMRQAQALEEMSDEIDNIRVAWRWAVTRRQAAAIRKPIKGLWCFYEIRGWFQEGEATFRWASEELVRTTGSNEGSDSYLKVLHAYLQAHQGWYCLKLGRFEEAKELLQLSLAALRVCGSPAELVDALYFLGAVEWLTGDYAAARAHSTEELAVATEMGDPWEIGLAHGNIGLAVQSLGEYEEAEARWETAAAIFRGLGDQRLIAAGLRFLGELKCALGEYRKAQACLEESLALSRAIGERWIYGMCLAQLGHVSHVLGEHAEAQRLFRESVAVLRELGERWALLHTLNGLGTVALAHGAYIEARSSFREALALAWEAQALPEALGALDGLAHWQAEKGALDQALAQAVLVLNHPAAHQETRKRAAQLRTTLEAQLTPEQIAAAQACAQAMPFDVMVEDALGYGTGGDLPYKWALRMPSAWTSRLKSLKNLSEQPAG